MVNDLKTSSDDRRFWMSLLARAPHDVLAELWAATGMDPEFKWLRKPETGSVMIRGRAGGTGAPFNLGEMTVTRCSIALQDDTIGHGYVQGRSKCAAQSAALIDALMQTEAAEWLRPLTIEPLAAHLERIKKTRAAKAAATKVEFFTVARGEDK